MYNLTRQQSAKILWISTRSVDRYVKSWKLRSKKDGKIIYIHERDVHNISWDTNSSAGKVIYKKATPSYSETKSSQRDVLSETPSVADAQNRATIEKIYLDLRSEIQTKDKAIQDLSIKLWQAQEIAKNSVSLIEFKKSQFLLEESKGHMSHELTDIKRKQEELKMKLKYEKSTNYILIVVCAILVITCWTLLFLKI